MAVWARFIALDTSLQRYVAVKVIHGGDRSGMDSEGQARLMYEAVAQARVNHPNIVTIYFVGRESETPFLAMELIDGSDASELIKQGQVPYETLCSMALKITHALDVASQTGIVHADIKPQNLLILNDGNVKLSDFGMARMAEQSQQHATGGTPNYLAPELLKGEQPNMQSDMYALGVTLFELTFGRLPIALCGSTLPEWLAIHESARIEFPEPWPEHLPESWRKILRRLLAKDPQHRYASYQELGSELREVMPVKRPAARLFARSIAWLIDFVTIGLSVVFPAALLSLLGLDIPDELQNTILLPSLCLYTVLTYWWRQSLGRELVHVKIVNRYSLPPAGRVMVLRELLRMQLLWWIILGGFMGLVFPAIELVFAGTGLACTAADVLYAATVGRGQSLHDRFTHTRAVVGSDSH